MHLLSTKTSSLNNFCCVVEKFLCCRYWVLQCIMRCFRRSVVEHFGGCRWTILQRRSTMNNQRQGFRWTHLCQFPARFYCCIVFPQVPPRLCNFFDPYKWSVSLIIVRSKSLPIHKIWNCRSPCGKGEQQFTKLSQYAVQRRSFQRWPFNVKRHNMLSRTRKKSVKTLKYHSICIFKKIWNRQKPVHLGRGQIICRTVFYTSTICEATYSKKEGNRKKKKMARRGSNSRPWHCQAHALPIVPKPQHGADEGLNLTVQDQAVKQARKSGSRSGGERHICHPLSCSVYFFQTPKSRDLGPNTEYESFFLGHRSPDCSRRVSEKQKKKPALTCCKTSKSKLPTWQLWLPTCAKFDTSLTTSWKHNEYRVVQVDKLWFWRAKLCKLGLSCAKLCKLCVWRAKLCRFSIFLNLVFDKLGSRVTKCINPALGGDLKLRHR